MLGLSNILGGGFWVRISKEVGQGWARKETQELAMERKTRPLLLGQGYVGPWLGSLAPLWDKPDFLGS